MFSKNSVTPPLRLRPIQRGISVIGATLLCLLWEDSAAQNANVPQVGPAPTVPGRGRTGAPGGLPASPLFSTPSTGATSGDAATDPKVKIQFEGDTDVQFVLDYYEQLTGKRCIYSNQVVGNIKLSIKGDVPRSEAIRLIEIALQLNGFYLVPGEGNIVKVTFVNGNPRAYNVPFVDLEELLPPTEQVVTFLFKLTYADPTELAQLIQQGVLVQSQGGYTTVVPLPKAQALLVTETVPVIRTLIRIVRSIDVPPAVVESAFISLERADAETVVKDIEEVLKKEPTSGGVLPGGGVPGGVTTVRTVQGPDGVPIPAGSPTPANGAVTLEVTGSASSSATLTEDGLIVGKIKIIADKRTNRIHVVTRPANMRFITDLIRKFDEDVKFGTPVVRPLRYVLAEDVLDILEQAVSDPGSEGTTGGSTAAPGARTPATNTGNRAGQDRFGSNSSSTFGGSSLGGSSDIGESLQTSEREIKPLAKVIGSTRIIADTRANSIIVIGNDAVRDKIFTVLSMLDVRQPMVLISTVVGELTLNDSKEFGVDYILRNSGVLGGTTTTTPGTDGTPGATQGTRIVGFTDGSPIIDLNALLNRSDIRALSTLGSGGVSGFITAGSAFNAVVRALESNNRFKVISRPSIFTSNNRQASIRAGEEVPVPTNIQSSFGSANTNVVSNSNIQFKPVELELQVSPVINSEDEVTLEIVQNISERAGSQRIDNNDIPIISRRALKTVVTVPNESMLVLGGLIRGTTNHTKGGIPLLNRVPLVGPLFGNAQKETRRSELVVIMRTSVTHSAMQTQSIRERFYGSPTLDPDLTKNVFAEPPPPPSRQPAAVATAVAASSAAPRGTAVEATKGATGTTGTKGVPVPTAAKAQEQRGTRKPVTPTGAYRK